ncbi:hypothetical protein BH24ACT15_BH24ACT15_30390 [soil metagenome]
MNVVDAMQVPYRATPDELDRIARWCDGTVQRVGCVVLFSAAAVAIVRAGPGWWIIRDDGGFTVMSPGQFGARYEAAS